MGNFWKYQFCKQYGKKFITLKIEWMRLEKAMNGVTEENRDKILTHHFIFYLKNLIDCVDNGDIETMNDCDKWEVFSRAISAMKYIAKKYEINY